MKLRLGLKFSIVFFYFLHICAAFTRWTQRAIQTDTTVVQVSARPPKRSKTDGQRVRLSRNIEDALNTLYMNPKENIVHFFE
jgi:hypothetical protein